MHAGTKSDLKHVDQTNYPPSPALSVSGAMVSEAEPDFGGQASGTVLLLRFLQDVGALMLTRDAGRNLAPTRRQRRQHRVAQCFR